MRTGMLCKKNSFVLRVAQVIGDALLKVLRYFHVMPNIIAFSHGL